MKKLKTIAAAVLLTAAATTANAQDIFDSPDLNHPYFGVRLSYELSVPTDINYKTTDFGSVNVNGFDAGSGFNLGAVYNIPVWRNLYVEPGVTLYYNTLKINKDYLGTIVEGNYDFTSASVRQWGLRIPILVGYHFDFIPDLRLSFFTGPELDLGIKSRLHLGVDRFDASASTYGDDGEFNRCDIKWRIGVGATFKDHYYAAISGAPGLCDLAKGSAAKMRKNLFDITLGYNF